jgi:succinoglycan biosynthesis protein ExoA
MIKLAIAIPVLNEVRYLANLIQTVTQMANGYEYDIFIADGGSLDGSVELVKDVASNNSRVHYLHNAGKIQACGVNQVARSLDSKFTHLIRLDAHSLYPEYFISNIIRAFDQYDVSSVVVPMHTVGQDDFTNAAALAFNSVLGNGASAHRNSSGTTFVDHGHHAGFLLKDYLALGGYDETFIANEDAEYDFRLAATGKKILLLNEAEISYFPRDSSLGIFRQYKKYGQYRFLNLWKHKSIPKIRQLLPVFSFWSLCLALISVLLVPVFNSAALFLAIPFSVYVSFIVLVSLALFKSSGIINAGMASMIAMTAHLSFGFGFTASLLRCLIYVKS